jgi:predicted aconitase
VKLDADQRAMLAGEGGPALRWAIEQQVRVGDFFRAPRLVPVGSVLAGAEIGITGVAGLELLEALAAQGARVRVPSYTAACSLDFARWQAFGLPQAQHDAEARLHAAMRAMGFDDVSSCVIYQTVGPPRFGEHLGWGDTGAVSFANSACGARSNYEGGPASIAAALTGCVPEYGFHLAEKRSATRLYRVTAAVEGVARWSALGAWIGLDCASYWEVPALLLEGAPPSTDELKQFLASAASLGSLAMVHIVGVTPEAPSVQAAFGHGRVVEARRVGEQELADVERRYAGDGGRVDLVVFSAPQLSLDEFADVVARLSGRQVARGTRLILTVNQAVEAQARRSGLLDALEAAGGEILVGTCFYVMSPALVRARMGFRTLVTPSAKLANILGGAGYRPSLRSVAACIEAAVTGQLPG